MKVRGTSLPGVLLVEPAVFADERGFFFESYRRDKFLEHGIEVAFVQDNHSRSRRNVIRGLHYQGARAPQHRLVRCTVGEVFDVAVDLRIGSATFGRWFGVRLSADNLHQLLIPPAFAHGFAVLSDVAEVQYKVSAHHDPSAERCLAWDDPGVDVVWPVSEPILSPRDRTGGERLADYIRSPEFIMDRVAAPAAAATVGA